MSSFRRIPKVGKAMRVALVVALLLSLGGGSAMVVSAPGGASPSGTSSNGGGGLLGLIRGWVGGHGGNDRPVVRPRRLTEGAVPRVDALPAAKKWPAAKRVRELPARRTANGTFYQLSDGRVQAEISAAPVHYRGAGGLFQPIDTTVRPASAAGFVAGNATNVFSTLFGDWSSRLLRLQFGDRWWSWDCRVRRGGSVRGSRARA